MDSFSSGVEVRWARYKVSRFLLTNCKTPCRYDRHHSIKKANLQKQKLQHACSISVYRGNHVVGFSTDTIKVVLPINISLYKFFIASTFTVTSHPEKVMYGTVKAFDMCCSGWDRLLFTIFLVPFCCHYRSTLQVGFASQLLCF